MAWLGIVGVNVVQAVHSGRLFARRENERRTTSDWED